jgi:hypothetical protein
VWVRVVGIVPFIKLSLRLLNGLFLMEDVEVTRFKNLSFKLPPSVGLGRQQKVQPRPGDVVVFQRGQHQWEVAYIFQVLLFAAFVGHADGHFGDLYVDEQFVFLCSLLYNT